MTSGPEDTGNTRREQIVSAAAELFRRHGFDGVGVDDIGAAVGLSGPAMYRYFPSKHALLEEVISEFATSLRAEVGRLSSHSPDGQHILDAAIRLGQRNPNGFAVYVRQRVHLDEEGADRVKALRAPLVANWNSWLGAAHVEPETVTRALRLRCISGALVHASLSNSPSKRHRARLAENMSYALLTTPVPETITWQLRDDPETPQLQHTDRREAILAAATELFRQRGFTKVTLRDIGEVVGITASAVSRHFETKEHLLDAAFGRASAQISAAIAISIRRSRSAEAAALEVVRRYTTVGLDFRDLIIINATQVHALPPAAREARRRRHRSTIKELAELIRAARPDLPKDECHLRAGTAYSVINEVVTHPTLHLVEDVAEPLTLLAQSTLFPYDAPGH